MKREYKQRLFNNTFKQVLWYYFRSGVKSSIRSIPKMIAIIILIAVFLIIWSKREAPFKPTAVFADLQKTKSCKAISR